MERQRERERGDKHIVKDINVTQKGVFWGRVVAASQSFGDRGVTGQHLYK